MYGKKGSWLAAAGFYVSMQYRADKMYEKLMERDDHPYKTGYKESQKKLVLYHKNKKSYRAFLNCRNMGGQPVAERVRRGPMLYAQILEGDGRYGRGLNRGIIQERRRLVKVGVNYCIFCDIWQHTGWRVNVWSGPVHGVWQDASGIWANL